MVFLVHAHAKNTPPPSGSFAGVQLRRGEGGWWAGWSGWVGWLAGWWPGWVGWLTGGLAGLAKGKGVWLGWLPDGLVAKGKAAKGKVVMAVVAGGNGGGGLWR